MDNKDIKLFNDAIHNVKKIISDIARERNNYKAERLKIRDKHDKEMGKLIGKADEVLQELYILFEDLTDDKGL